MLYKGQSTVKTLQEMATKFLDAAKPALTEPKLPVILAASLEEIVDCMQFLEALVSDDDCGDAGGVALEKVMSAKTGVRFILKNAVLQQNFYRKLEVELKQAAVASKTLVPEKDEIEKKLADMDLAQLLTVCKRMPAFVDGLRRGTASSR